MRIAEFVKATGLPRDTVRFYVKKGLLQPEVGRGGTNRYQHFDAEQIDRALLIREKQALGFTLDEIAVLSAEFARGISPSRHAEVMRERLVVIDEQAARLARLRRYFKAKIAWLEGGAVTEPPSFARIVGATKALPDPFAKVSSPGSARRTTRR